MTVRLTFLCAAAGDGTRGTRSTVFGDGPPSERVLREACVARAAVPSYLPSLRAPSARCATVAAALGLEPAVEPVLRDIDYGTWRGRTVEEVAADDPHGFTAWLRDPDATPHGGESVRRLCRRTADWLDGLPPDTGRALVIAEPAAVRALLVHALAAPARAFWRLDAPALCTISFTARDGRWAVRPGRFPVHSGPGQGVWGVSDVGDVSDLVRHVGPARATEARGAVRRRMVSGPRPGLNRNDVNAAG